MKTFSLLLILNSLFFQSQVFACIENDESNNLNEQYTNSFDVHTIKSSTNSDEPKGLVLFNRHRMKTNTIELGQLLKIKKLNSSYIMKGNLVSVSDSSLTLVRTKRNSIDTSTIMFDAIGIIQAIRPAGVRVLASLLTVGGVVVAPALALGAVLTLVLSAGDDLGASIGLAAGSAATFFMIPLSSNMQ